MKSEIYFVLLSEDGLFYMSHEGEEADRKIQLTRSPICAKTWDWKDDANQFNVNELSSRLRLGQITLTVERLG
jgi:hypothetical protein